MSFEQLNLNKNLLRALEDKGFLTPTPIQSACIPAIMSGKDVVGIAQTGTGKTLAYLLPTLRMLGLSKANDLRICVLVPTRELVVQVTEEIEVLLEYTDYEVVGVFGGANINTQKLNILEKNPQVIVGTPGRFYDLVMHQSIRLKSIKHVIFDEVDEMFEQGFRIQLRNILEILPNRKQSLMFSATLSKDVQQFINEFFRSPEYIEIDPAGTPVEKVSHTAYYVPNFKTKVGLLKFLLASTDQMSKVLVFTSTKRFADLLMESFEQDEDFSGIGVIHSNKSQNYRLRMVEEFKEGTLRVLIATDIISRGLDIQGVSDVINFDYPETKSDFVHRVGRTGRAEETGRSITFVKHEEEEFLEELRDQLSIDIPLSEFPENVPVIEELLPEETPKSAGDKDYLGKLKMDSKGAFHQKKAKNLKVNRAQEKRLARMKEKRSSKRRKKN